MPWKDKKEKHSLTQDILYVTQKLADRIGERMEKVAPVGYAAALKDAKVKGNDCNYSKYTSSFRM